MATTKEIKNRIKSVKDTAKITNAMYLISSTKLRKARKSVEMTKPYFDLLRKEFQRIFIIDENIGNKYFDDLNGDSGVSGILLITADRGLAGNYNQVLIKQALSLIEKENDYRLYVVGEYGKHFLESHGYNMAEDFNEVMREPNLDLARSISYRLKDDIDTGKIDRLYVCYADFAESTMGCDADYTRLVPFDRTDYAYDESNDSEPVSTDFIYEPSIEVVADQIMGSYITGFVYSALVNCYCVEQNSRMMAMDAANKNAKELEDQLMLDFNHARQGLITQEITEISSGAKSLRNKKR